MKKITLVAIQFLVLLGVSGCDSKDVQSSWIEVPIIVDGISSDWENIPLTDFEDQNIYMGFGNTNDKLYILVGFNDPTIAQLFRRGGITLWLDDTGKRDKEIGIKYVPPFDRENSLIGGPAENMPPEQRKQFEERFRNRRTGLSVVNRIGESYQIDPGDDVPEGEFKSEFWRFTLELMIPLQRGKRIPYAIDISEDTKISLGLEIGSPGNLTGRRSFGRPGGGGRSGGGRGGGGRGGGGIPGGGGNSRGRSGGGFDRQSFQAQEIWFLVQLADVVE